MDTNPYAPPKAELRDVVQGDAAPPLWNPRAAALWSFLLFSPAFGAFVQERNWRALGEPGKAFSSRIWGIAMLLLVLTVPLLGLFKPFADALGHASPLSGPILFLVWHVLNGRTQVYFVRARFGKDYPRRSWAVPLLSATAAFAGYLVFVTILVRVRFGAR